MKRLEDFVETHGLMGCKSAYIEYLEKELAKRITKKDDNNFNDAVEYVQETYCKKNNTPFMLLGDVATLIEITTSKEVDWNILAKYE